MILTIELFVSFWLLCMCIGMSERIACSIAREYPTPRRLWDTYLNKCSTDKQREILVQDVLVSTGPGARATRIGPALSKGLYQAMWLKHSQEQTNNPSGTHADALSANDDEME